MKAKIIDYKKYIDHLLTFNALFDPDGNVLMANRTAIEAAGLSYDDVIGKYFPDIRWLSYDPQAQKRVANAIDRAKKGDTIIVEEKGRMAETDVIVQLSLKPVFDKKGKVEYIIAEGQDITKIKEVEKELRKSHALINAVSNFVGIVGIDGKLQLVNQKTIEQLGFAEEELLGIAFWECGWFLSSPESVEIIKNSIDKALDGKTIRAELKVFTKHGREVPIFYFSTPLFDDSGKTIGIAVEGVDISEIMERGAQLAQSEAMYRGLATYMNEGLGITDAMGNFTFVNPKLCEMLEYSAEELVGVNAKDLLDEENRLLFLSEAKKRAKGEFSRYEITFTKKSGRKLHVFTSASPIMENGVYKGTRAVVTDLTQVKKKEDLLQKSEAMYRDLTDRMNEGLGITDTEGNIVYVNPKYAKMMEYSREEMIGMNVKDLLDEENRQIWKRERAKRAKNEAAQYEVTFTTKTGQKLHALLSASPVFENGVYKGSNTIVTDFTKLKEKEDLLQKSEAMYRDLTDRMNEGLGITDAKGNFVYLNPKYAEMMEYSREEMIGMNVKDLLDEENRQIWKRERAKRAKNEAAQYEVTFTTKTGQKLHALLSASPIFENDVYKGSNTIVTDFTRLKEKEELLQKSEAMYRDLVTHMNEGLAITDAMGNYTFVNPEYCKMLEYSQEELLGMNAKELLDEENRLLLLTEAKKRARGQFSQYELTYVTKSGKKLNTLLSASPIMENGVYKGTRGVVADLTALKGMEAKLLQAQKMEAVGILAGGVAHDFNNILQAIFGYTQILMLNKKPDDPELRYLQTIEKSAQKAGALTKQLLTFGRKVESHLQPVNLNLKINNVTEILSRTLPKMIEIELHLAEDLKIVNADPVQIEQIIMNFGVNAADAMPDGGQLIFETENVMLDEKYINSHLGSRPGEYVLLSVSDTGVGMDQETLQHIFEPFFTTKAVGKGTGLGLATVYGIVKSHNGYITCYSEPGQGTTFKIYLPTIETLPAEPALKIIENEELPRGSETILLVDDEEALRNLGQEILQGQGFSAIPAESGESAIEIYQENKDRIDLVILDVSMPGMGGHRCFQELKKINPQVKVIVATGYSANGRVKEMIKSGAAGFIGKPYRLADILNKIREVLDKK